MHLPRLLAASLFAAAAVASLAAVALAADPALVAERRERALAAVASDDEAIVRAKSLAELGELDDAAAAKALAECVTALGVRQTQLEATHQLTLKAYEKFQGFSHEDRRQWELKERLLDQLEQEDRRLQGLGVLAQATVVAIQRLRDPAGLAALEKHVAAEGDPQARAVLWEGLLSNTATKGPQLAKAALKDETPVVHLAVYRALRARKDPQVLDAAVQGLKEPGWPARKEAVAALLAMNDVRAVPPLVAAMQNEEGALLEDFGRALAALTGENLGHHPDVWRRWYEDHKAELAQKGGKPVVPRPDAPRPVPIDFYGIETLSRRVLFVIDISGSMKEPIGNDPVEQTGVSRKDQVYSGPKIEVAKRVLSQAVHNLAKDANFNIVFFNHQVRTFEPQMVLATAEAKGKADFVISELQPVGATWAYGALQQAFQFAGVTGAPVTGKFDPQVDTIFFLSDGAPTDGATENAQPMEPKVILDAVREWNRQAKVRIHVVAIDPSLGKGAFIRFMKGLAAENGGTYTAIGSTK